FLRTALSAAPTCNRHTAATDGPRAPRGAAPEKPDEGPFYEKQYDHPLHNREQGTENDQNDLLCHWCEPKTSASEISSSLQYSPFWLPPRLRGGEKGSTQSIRSIRSTIRALSSCSRHPTAGWSARI